MSAVIAPNMVVDMHYTLRDSESQVVDTSVGEEPLRYLQGGGQIVPGLESAMIGKKVGDRFTVQVEPRDGYGDYDPSMCQEIPKQNFPNQDELVVDAMFEASGPDGDTIMIRLTKISDETVTADGNHPLAGKTLYFEIEVMAIRPATKEELSHGHAHGGEGHVH